MSANWPTTRGKPVPRWSQLSPAGLMPRPIAWLVGASACVRVRPPYPPSGRRCGSVLRMVSRGTPTLGNGRVYAFGATGIVNALDAGNGAVVWSRNAASDTGAEVPTRGFSSSPLIVGDLVIVAAGSRLVAYDVATGEPRWFAKIGGGSYSSPQRMTIGGITQVLMLSGVGATSVGGELPVRPPSPFSGTLLKNAYSR